MSLSSCGGGGGGGGGREEGKKEVKENSRDPKVVVGEGGYVLEDVPHLIDYLPDLPVPLSLSL